LQFSTFSPDMFLSIFFTAAILVDGKYHLTVDLTYLSLMTNLEYFCVIFIVYCSLKIFF
jgi:hypothetical protein